MSIGFKTNIEEDTLDNEYFRRVLYTVPTKTKGPYTNPGIQLTVMSIEPDSDIGWELHEHVSQFIRIEEGTGLVIFRKGDKEKSYKLTPADAIIIPAGTHHNVFNTSKKEALKLYSIYTPPNHPPRAIEITKPEHD